MKNKHYDTLGAPPAFTNDAPLSVEEGRALLKKKAKVSKYRNKIIKTKDGTFHSIKEHKRWLYLKTLEQGNLIRELQRQYKFDFKYKGENICTYVADFAYTMMNKKTGDRVFIVEDVKGWDKKTGKYITTPMYEL